MCNELAAFTDSKATRVSVCMCVFVKFPKYCYPSWLPPVSMATIIALLPLQSWAGSFAPRQTTVRQKSTVRYLGSFVTKQNPLDARVVAVWVAPDFFPFWIIPGFANIYGAAPHSMCFSILADMFFNNANIAAERSVKTEYFLLEWENIYTWMGYMFVKTTSPYILRTDSWWS